MVIYTLELTSQGESSLAALDKKIEQRILNKLKWLIQNAENVSNLSLEANLSGFYKLRVGDWRVLYTIDHNKKIVTVHKAGHRKDIYK